QEQVRGAIDEARERVGSSAVQRRARISQPLRAHPSNVRELESEAASLAANKDKTRETLRRHGAIGEYEHTDGVILVAIAADALINAIVSSSDPAVEVRGGRALRRARTGDGLPRRSQIIFV